MVEYRNLSCVDFSIEQLTSEFLRIINEIHAKAVYKYQEKIDDYSNWLEGKKLTAFTIIDCYLKECREQNQCVPLPECAYEYLDEIKIDEVKELKAYFIWHYNGRKISKDTMYEHFVDGCHELFSFCDYLPSRGKDCVYNNVILKRVDRRQGMRRVNNQPIVEDRRKSQDRRQFDHRGDENVNFLL